MKENIKNGNYTVALFDILGFKEMILNMPLEELARRYEYVIGKCADYFNYHLSDEFRKLSIFPNHPVGKPFCNKYIFSDSIILFSEDGSSESCLKLLIYAWRLSQQLLVSGFPSRGAVTHGEVYVNDAQKIFLGKALTDAYELERSQKWIGASIDFSVFKAFPDLSTLIKSEDYIFRDLFMEYDVPMKDEKILKMRTLNWRWNLIVQKGTRSLFPYSSDQRVIIKQKNSLEYTRQFVSTGRVYMKNQDKIPVELRSMWVGDKEPPFEHGDEL
jgi:hypothetical protein